MQEANKVIVKYPTTKVDIEVDGQKLPLEVPVAEVQPVDVLLGCDVPFENLIIRQMALETLEQVMVVIRTKKKKQLQEEAEQKAKK